MHNPFRYFNSSPEVIRLTVMMYVRFPLSLRQVEDLLYERGDHIDKNYAPEARTQSVVFSLDDGEESYWGDAHHHRPNHHPLADHPHSDRHRNRAQDNVA
jgi:hypothetical protein